MARAVHNSRDSFYRSPSGAVPCSQQVVLRLRVDVGEKPERVLCRVWSEGTMQDLAMKDLGSSGLFQTYEIVLHTPKDPCLLWYHFQVLCRGGAFYYGNAQDGMGGLGSEWQNPPPAYQMTVYDGAFAPPAWMKDGIMYQIFTDRFFDGYQGKLLTRRPEIKVHTDWYESPDRIEEGRTGDNIARDFFGGNLRGIEQKLDYIASLGVSALYLNPIFRAHSNHKYDTGDYTVIDPTFGEEEDFRSLCTAAKARGIHIVLDGVFSHTGEDSVYFNRYGRYNQVGAYQSLDSAYAPWYKFRKHPDDYVCWWGVPTLPEVQEMHPSFVDFIINHKNSVVAQWLRAGAFGWRLDVADELPDEFIEMLRTRVKQENPDACIIGEVWEDATNKVAYGQQRKYALGHGLDSVMNYPLRAAVIDFLLERDSSSVTRRRLMVQKENYPLPMYYALMNLIGSHDRARIINILAQKDMPTLTNDAPGEYRMEEAEYQLGSARLQIMLTIFAALPGMPCVYYADEAGQQGLADPYCRCTYPWGREDQSLVDSFRKILTLRRKLCVLRTGEIYVYAPHVDVLGIARKIENGVDALGNAAPSGVAFVFVNRATVARRVALDVGSFGKMELYGLDGHAVDILGGVLSLLVPPMGSLILLDLKTLQSLAQEGKTL